MSRTNTLSILLIGGLLFGGWLNYYFSDKQVITRQLGALAEEISKEGQETPIQMGLKMGKVKKRLSTPCQVIIPEQSPMRPLEQDIIIRYLIYYRQRYGRIIMTFENLDIIVPDTGRATVATDIHILRQVTADESKDGGEIYPVRLKLIKHEELWQIKEVELPETLIQ